MFLMRGGRINQGQGQGWGCGLVGDKIYIIPQEIHSSLQKCYIHPWMNRDYKSTIANNSTGHSPRHEPLNGFHILRVVPPTDANKGRSSNLLKGSLLPPLLSTLRRLQKSLTGVIVITTSRILLFIIMSCLPNLIPPN